jgi:hypothetical protein
MTGKERVSFVFRGLFRWKLLFDLLTLIVLGLITASYWAPAHVSVGEGLVEYWFYALSLFVGAREVSRWIGDHDSGKYVLHFITHGEIYLLLFLILPFTMRVPDAFLQTTTSTVQEEVMSLADATALKVVGLYLFTAISKGSIGRRKWLLDHLSSLASIATGRGKGNDNDAAGP